MKRTIAFLIVATVLTYIAIVYVDDHKIIGFTLMMFAIPAMILLSSCVISDRMESKLKNDIADYVQRLKGHEANDFADQIYRIYLGFIGGSLSLNEAYIDWLEAREKADEILSVRI